MPQLDANTFIYQYLGIITLFVVVYILLGYIVLPILLRLISIKSRFLETKQVLNDSLVLIDSSFKSSLLLRSYDLVVVSARINSFIKRSLNVAKTTIALLRTFSPHSSPISAIKNSNSTILTISFIASDFYLMLLLTYYDLNFNETKE